MKKIIVKKNLKKNIKKIKKHLSAVYSNGHAVIYDPVSDASFKVAYQVLMYAKDKLNFPTVKVKLPAVFGQDGNIRFKETSHLIKNLDGNWVKTIDIQFNRNSEQVVGVKSITEEVELGSLDIIIIAQIEDLLNRKLSKTLSSPSKVTA